MLTFVIIFCSFLNYSMQNLQELAEKQGLYPEDVELIRQYEAYDRVKRQQLEKTYKSKIGLPQSIICGINGHSISRFKREEEQFPQGSEDWPWTAIINTGDGKMCGGTLINRRYILTAAHCLKKPKINKENIEIILGEYDVRSTTETQSKRFKAEDLMIHEFYQSTTQRNDIAVLKLNETVEYTRFIRPLCLASTQPNVGEMAIVAGWGQTQTNGHNSEILLYTSVPIWSHEDCKNAYGEYISVTQICAASRPPGRDSCQGDSGGPLMFMEREKRWVITGIVSTGLDCAGTTPGIYTSVSKHLYWIAEKVGDASP